MYDPGHSCTTIKPTLRVYILVASMLWKQQKNGSRDKKTVHTSFPKLLMIPLTCRFINHYRWICTYNRSRSNVIIIWSLANVIQCDALLRMSWQITNKILLTAAVSQILVSCRPKQMTLGLDKNTFERGAYDSRNCFRRYISPRFERATIPNFL